MSKSISQLAEQERAKLLEAIEAQANRISTKRDPRQAEVSLSDWLNAAEKIIPTNKEPSNPGAKAYQINQLDETLLNNKAEPSWDELFAQEPRAPIQSEVKASRAAVKSTTNQAPSNRLGRNRKANPAKTGPYFGVVVMLSLLLAMTGILYLAYMLVTDEFERLETLVIDQEAQILQLETLVMDTQMLLEQHEDAPIVVSLMQRLTELEAAQLDAQRATSSQDNVSEQVSQAQIDALAAAQQTLQQQVERTIALQNQQPNPEFIAQLEQQILQRLQQSSQLLAQQAAPSSLNEPEVRVTTPAVTAPTVPTPPAEPAVAAVEEITEIAVVAETPSSPMYSSRVMNDINWLAQQADQHFIIQLAAMVQVERLEQMVSQHNLTDARILPQVRNGQTRYILVMGTHAQRPQAVEQANRIKEQTGITPWVRRVNDINGSVR
ncbi:hypothetical protein THIAE_04970 [Thiomicrospira aerophila AL3]|uniref:SPOR domain-containing protein n=1 Tax=Thiomicrospira aerophila AL3 TaxID=717772 RepID=W0DZH4_9GAMM|nr:SPOR domain-containing protein [Thiomicrospira aerophila]AHF02246.1 hypothetical protein THIAE_04970 [Thiomicrospira aerophila AL3]